MARARLRSPMPTSRQRRGKERGVRTLRQAAADDVPALLPLVQAYWAFEAIDGFAHERVGAQLARLLSDPALGAGWIAFDAGAAVGYLLGVRVFSLEYQGLTAEIDELFVLPSQRGAGVGERLLHAAEADFRRWGYTQVALQVAHDNAAAQGFYARRGYAARPGYALMDKRLDAV